MAQLQTNFRIRVKKDAVVHLKRSLPDGKGKLNVFTVGQEISPADILGEGQAQTGFRTINLAKELAMPPQKAIFQLKPSLGQTVYKGELLASRQMFFGFSKKNLLAPADGVIEYYDEKTGDLRLKLLPKTTKLASGVYGIIDAVDQSAGVVTIRTVADLVYGLVGSGREREGILEVLGSRDDLISSRQIKEEMTGKILLGGSIIFIDALERAVSLKVAGIITGGINAKDFKSMAGGELNLFEKHWSDVGLTLMVTEGFGSIPMGEDIYQLLKVYHQKFVLVDGNEARVIIPTSTKESMDKIRKTSLPVGVETEAKPDIEAIALNMGQLVRVVAAPHEGIQGRIEAIDQSVTQLPSGMSTYMVNVVSSSKKVRVPYQNIEVINSVEKV